MSRIGWRPNRQYPVFVAGAYKQAFLKAADGPIARRQGLADDPYYKAAKYEGDAKAALRVVERVMDRLYMMKIRWALADLERQGVQNPILVAPYKADSPNRLARTAAMYLGRELGLEVDSRIVEKPGLSLKTLTKLERLFNSPDFEGAVEPGRWYIAIDDTISSGTTMAALRSHIAQNGGRFACGCALASPGGKDVVLNASPDEIGELTRTLGRTLVEWLERKTNVSLDGLTKAETALLRKPEAKREIVGLAVQAGLFQS